MSRMLLSPGCQGNGCVRVKYGASWIANIWSSCSKLRMHMAFSKPPHSILYTLIRPGSWTKKRNGGNPLNRTRDQFVNRTSRGALDLHIQVTLNCKMLVNNQRESYCSLILATYPGPISHRDLVAGRPFVRCGGVSSSSPASRPL